MSGTLLELEHLAKRYDSPDGGLDVLRDVNFSLDSGRKLAIVGPSGCGKSTLLNLIAALDRPTSGRVLLGGRDLSALADSELAAVRRTDIGLVFQMHHLLPQCTAIENVLMPLLASGRRVKPQHRQRAEDLLGRVGLKDRMNYRPGGLSVGQCQRVALARAVIHRPALLLGDEPSGSLDRDGAAAMADLLVELNESEAMAMIVVTHSRPLAERMGRIMSLRDGILVNGRDT